MPDTAPGGVPVEPVRVWEGTLDRDLLAAAHYVPRYGNGGYRPDKTIPLGKPFRLEIKSLREEQIVSIWATSRGLLPHDTAHQHHTEHRLTDLTWMSNGTVRIDFKSWAAEHGGGYDSIEFGA